MQKNVCLSDVTNYFYRHDCRISESSFVSLTTMRNLFCDTVIFSRNFHLRLAIYSFYFTKLVAKYTQIQIHKQIYTTYANIQIYKYEHEHLGGGNWTA